MKQSLRRKALKGTIRGAGRQFAFFIPEEKGIPDIYVSQENLRGALQGDTVILELIRSDHRDKPAGRVVKILNSERNEIIGTVAIRHRSMTLLPLDKRMGPVSLNKPRSPELKENDLVAVRIMSSTGFSRYPAGEVLEVMGSGESPQDRVSAIARLHGLPSFFPSAVERAAAGLGKTIPPDGIKGRTDYRALPTVTIDGADAKDLDDAISVQRLDHGSRLLGVHIADVSHYVGKGGELDREARIRGTSTYLYNTVIPMLPEALSNGLCSLNPGVDRLTLSVMMEVDSCGQVVKSDIVESVIRTSERLTHGHVMEILDGRGNRSLAGFLQDMVELAFLLKEKRKHRGAMDFNLRDTEITLDTSGVPVDVQPNRTTVAHQIIEEFMILCNETVAERFSRDNRPLIYRVHDQPDKEEIQALNQFIKAFGYEIHACANLQPKILQQLLNHFRETQVENLIHTVTLKTLKKAVYSVGNIGHFGLASKAYCHFTAPIRRYPDLINHRLVKSYLAGKPDRDDLAEISDHGSLRERVAEKAERDVTSYYKALYMSKHLGDLSEGIISGITGFGLFVELPNTVEGLVRIENLPGSFTLQRSSHALVDARTGKRYVLGDLVRVKIFHADTRTGEVELLLLDERRKTGTRLKTTNPSGPSLDRTRG